MPALQTSDIAPNCNGFLNPATRHVLSGWARDAQHPRRAMRVELEEVATGTRLRLRARPQHREPTAPNRFVCHLRQGLAPGSLINGLVSETGEPLVGAPRVVSAQESTLALQSARYDYLVYYNAKSACTWLRELFAVLHGEETQMPIDRHNLAPAFRPDPGQLPTTALALVRDPVARWISCFLDKVVSWSYERRISRAAPILRWRFGADRRRYPELSFLDFLDYLNAGVYPADEHFWPQPLYLPSVHVARVESLETDLLAFYAEHRPELLSRVERFIRQDQGLRNASRNTALSRRAHRPGAETLGIGALARSIQDGIGIEPESFLGEPSLARLATLTQAEREAYGYPLHT